MWGLPPRRHESRLQLQEALRAVGRGATGTALTFAGARWKYVALGALVLVVLVAGGAVFAAR
jgi:hypothetical protein